MNKERVTIAGCSTDSEGILAAKMDTNVDLRVFVVLFILVALGCFLFATNDSNLNPENSTPPENPNGYEKLL